MARSAKESGLIARLQAGDPSAVTELAATYWPHIFQLALRHMRNPEDAEEVAQDVLLKVCRKIKAFRGDSALSSWIYRITFNTAMSRLRTRRFLRLSGKVDRGVMDADRESPSRCHEPVDRSALPDERLLRRQLQKRLRTALAEIPPIYRTPVVLRDLHALSTNEASELIDVKTQTMKSRLHRGRLALRERLGDFEGGLSLHPSAA
jgi:RNA polymerase sigma-70 factor (ECF subfamily)